jgi:hypothetical protein
VIVYRSRNIGQSINSIATEGIQMTTFTNAESQIEALYVGYFGRAGDPAGVEYWLGRFAAGMSIATIAASFSVQTEATNLYPFLANPLIDDAAHDNAAAFINSVFEDLFNRAENILVDPSGFAYWLARVVGAASNPQAIGQIIEDIISGATGVDNTTLQDKVTVADFFTNDLAGSTQPFAGNAIAISQSSVTNTTSDPTTVTAQEAVITNFINQVPPLPGVNIDLTPNLDHIVISTINTADTVAGVLDQAAPGASTYTVGDNIHGNGLTTVEIAVNSVTLPTVAASHGTAPLTSMVGVSTVTFFQGQANTLDQNASLWTNVNNVNVVGEAGDVKITHLNVNNGLGETLSINTTSPAYLSATGHVSGLTYYAQLESGKGVGTVASFGTAGVNATVAKSGYMSLSLYQSVDHASKAEGAATVGNTTIGNVNINLGAGGASLDNLSIYNYAKAYDHNATVGNLTVGNVTIMADKAAGFASFEIYNEAYVATGTGNATAGNLTVGNVSVTHVGTAEVEAYIYNEASVYDYGNATVGNVTVGNVSLNVGSRLYADISNKAYVTDTGVATAGNLTVGNIAVVHGAHSHATMYVDNYASVDFYSAAATVGNVTVGNVSVTNAHSYVDLYIENGAKDWSGNATAGNLSVGNVALVANASAQNYVYIDNYASSYRTTDKGGVATVGNTQIGTVSMAVASGSNTMDVYQEAHNYGSKAHNATVGNLSIGNITMTDAIGTTKLGGAILAGSNELYVYNSADAYHGNATAGNITVGSISINAAAVTLQSSAANSVYLYNVAYASHGAATVGTITVGNVTANTGVAGYEYLFVENFASGASTASSSGLITVGNVTMNGGSGAFMEVSVYNEVKGGGTAGGITIGNVSMHETKTLGTGYLDVYQSGAVTGKVTVGNVAITGAKVGMYIENYATSGLAGGLSVGNVTLKGADYGPTNYIYQSALNGAAGAVTVGNVSLSDGKGQYLRLDVSNYAANKVGALTIGNVSVAVHNTNAATVTAEAVLHVETESLGGKAGGNITTGNITVGSSGDTTKATLANHMLGFVTLDSMDGNVTVGNITVTGGVVEAGGAKVVTDNFSTLSSWLTLTNGGGSDTTTIGNVDYSGYAGKGDASTIIDVHTYIGAASIIGSTAGTDITDNSGTNAIDVSHTTKADIINLQDSQSAVSDSGTALTAAQAAVDSIIGIHAGDIVNLVNHTSQAVDLVGTTITNGGAMSYATFLVNAETDLHSGGTDAAYTGNVGGNTYVALWNGSVVAEIVDVVGIHVLTVSGGAVHA